jgi:hypothetical protein
LGQVVLQQQVRVLDQTGVILFLTQLLALAVVAEEQQIQTVGRAVQEAVVVAMTMPMMVAPAPLVKVM